MPLIALYDVVFPDLTSVMITVIYLGSHKNLTSFIFDPGCFDLTSQNHFFSILALGIVTVSSKDAMAMLL